MTAPPTPRPAGAQGRPGTPGPAGTRRGPVDLPGPEGDNSIAREPLWYAYGAGDDAPEAPPWTWVPQPPPDTHVPPPPPRGGGPRRTLPLGTHDRLAALPFPAPPPREARDRGPEPVADRLGHALVTAFGPQRREPENPYNDHRPYASPRSLFPVHAFADGGAGMPWRLLEPDRHALTGTEAAPARTLVLTGRYTAVPPAYQWFRGSLVAIELGFVLRALSLGLELFDVPARLRLPDRDAHALLPALGLDDAWAWSLPFALDLDPDLDPDGADGTPSRGGPTPAPPEHVVRADPALAELIRVNREQVYDSAPAPLTTAVPEGLGPSATVPDWAELLWRRHSGRMPRALHGMSGRRRIVPAEALDSAARWLSVPPPGPELAAAFAALKVTAVVQGVAGRTDGVHDVRGGTVRLLRADATAPERIEEQYGYGVSPVNGCGIGNAPLTVFLSVRTRELFKRLGPAGWGAVQNAAGWAAHGLCLSAAASGLFARPVRAFKEIPTQRVLGLDPDEMIVLSVVVGVPQDTGGALLDLRL
ncbi:nitroreductase family protein [Streptomyces sp. NPDC048266]|uniref:nitroreductase family protein n=1 Tax=Streptomyces sp. NPDC048266 TaxID=3155787 RepID=UPI0033DEC9BE